MCVFTPVRERERKKTGEKESKIEKEGQGYRRDRCGEKKGSKRLGREVKGISKIRENFARK